MNARLTAFRCGAAAILAAGWVAFAEESRVIDGGSHHLGLEGEREWQDLDGQTPEGRSLLLKFEAQPNSQPATLFIRQRDVKLKWPVLLNGRKLGTLDLNEYPEVATLTIPPGLLRAGENALSILSPEMPDDIFIEEIRLDPRPPEQARRDAVLRVQVTDQATHLAIPCRITIADDQGSLAVLSAVGDQLAARAGVVYTADGRAEIGLRAGHYTIYASRGFEWGVARREITLVAGASEQVALEIEREVPTPGLVACDTHIHTFTYSKHGDATSDERIITLAGEGIELPVASDHNVHADYSAAAPRLGLADRFTSVLGNEVTTRVGHFIAFPVASATTPVPDSSLMEWAALLQGVRAVPGVQVVVQNHPRDTHDKFIPFAPENFNAASGDFLRGQEFSCDAIEVCNSGTLQSDFMRSFYDWFALLNHGYCVTGVGSSDSHDVARFIVGQGRTYIAGDDRLPGQLNVDEACRNLKAGHAYVSMGLLTRITVEGRFRAGDLATSLPDVIQVRAEVLAPSWAHAERVVLFANGLPIREAKIEPPASGPQNFSIEWTLPRPPHDIHLVAVADGPPVTAPFWAIPYPYQPTGRSRERRVIGASNPVWLDADADGKFSSAREYAGTVIVRRGMAPQKLLPALAHYDQAVAIQAASLCQAAGGDLRDPAFVSALQSAPESVRAGFAAFIANSAPR